MDNDAQRELVRIYVEAAGRLRRLTRQAVNREALGTAAFYRRQHEEVRRVLRELGRQTRPLAFRAILASYLEGLRIGRVVEPERNVTIDAAFVGVHRGAVEVAAQALVNRLEGAIVEVGRRQDDVFRRVLLEEIATTTAAGEGPRGQTLAAKRALEAEGVKAFVDKRGRAWPLDTYAAMATRTGSREVATEATVREMLGNGRDLIAISQHRDPCEICLPWQGRTYSISGNDERYPKATVLPPIHPNCLHVAYPSTARFEDIERELGLEPGGGEPPPAPVQKTVFPPQPEPEPELAPKLETPPENVAPSSVLEPTSRVPKDAYRDVTTALDRFLALPPRQTIYGLPVKYQKRGSDAGQFVSTGFGSAEEIIVSPLARSKELTLAHEFAHFLDLSFIGNSSGFDSEKAGTVLGDVLDAIKASGAVENLRRLLDEGIRTRHVRYLLGNDELWARAFSQWLAERSGNQSMADEIATRVEGAHPIPYHWTAEDFAPIRQAIDEFFRGLRWLKE